MEITRNNFQENLKDIQLAISRCHFMSIDLEFSGLGRHNRKLSQMDTPSSRYSKIREQIVQYGILQIGLSMFRMCPDKKIRNSTYCFYIQGNHESSFKSDVSALNFLAENNLDFNKLFKEGLSYLSLSEVKEKKNIFMQKTKMPKKILNLIGKPDMEKFQQETIRRIRDHKRFELYNLGAFEHRVVIENIAPMFPCVAFVTAEENVTVVPCNCLNEKERMEMTVREEIFTQMYGFGVVAEAISKSRKPIVGHNVFTDILHFVDKFVHPLPQDFDKLKQQLKSSFSSIYDTKMISTHSLLTVDKFGSLESLYESLSDMKPVIHPETESFLYSPSCLTMAHDAGHDAYITGLCFVTMITKIGCVLEDARPLNLSLIESYKNVVYVPHIFDMSSMNLMERDVIPDRSFVYHVTCPKIWNSNDIKGLCNPILKKYTTVWIDDNHFWVIPTEPAIKGNKSIEERMKLANIGVSVQMHDSVK